MNLATKIKEHVKMFASILVQTEFIFEYIKLRDLEQTSFLIGNRGRLINIVSDFQSVIEDEIAEMPEENLTQDTLSLLQEWQKIIREKVLAISQLDELIYDLLETQKDDTTREIATVFTARQNLKGYNLNHLSK